LPGWSTLAQRWCSVSLAHLSTELKM
jgi:hypothetical protein